MSAAWCRNARHAPVKKPAPAHITTGVVSASISHRMPGKSNAPCAIERTTTGSDSRAAPISFRFVAR